MIELGLALGQIMYKLADKHCFERIFFQAIAIAFVYIARKLNL